MGHGGDPRGWQFWRRAFWTRPAFVAAVALAAAVAVPVLVVHAGQSAAAGVAVHRGDLEEVPGLPLGPDSSRRTPDTWELVVGAGEVRDEFALGWNASRLLEEEGRRGVTGLVHHDEVVAVRLRSGRVLTTWATGGRGVLFFAGGAVMLTGLCVGGVGLARRRARAAGGWWSVRDGHVDMRTHDGASAFATVTIVGGGVVVLALLVGIPWWLVLAAPLVVAVPLLRPGRGRHVRG